MGNLVKLTYRLGNHDWVCPAGVRSVTCRTRGIDIGLAYASDNRACAVNVEDGKLYAWGDNASGQLGDGTTASRSEPTLVLFGGPGISASDTWPVVSAVQGIVSGYATANGTLFMCGFGGNGAIGNGSTASVSIPVKISTLKDIKSLVSDWWQSPGAIDKDGFLWRWGFNSYGQLGLGNTTTRSTPEVVNGIAGAFTRPKIYQACGMFDGEASMMLYGNGTVATCGRNTDVGILGLGDMVNRSTPTVIPSLSGVELIFGCRGQQAGVITTSGDAYMWGKNTVGQLGNGSTQNRSTPTLVAGGHKWRWLACGNDTTAGITTTGDLYVWGTNAWGSLGGASTSNVSTPVKVPSLGGVEYVMALTAGFIAFQNPSPTQPLYYMAAWGFGGAGRLGNGSTANYSTPTWTGNPMLTGGRQVDYGTASVATVPGNRYQIVVRPQNVKFGGVLVAANHMAPCVLEVEYFT